MTTSTQPLGGDDLRARGIFLEGASVGAGVVANDARTREQIDEALLRLADGTYGICEDCGREISERRLKAVPFARRCIECQEKTEAIEQPDQVRSRSQI